MIAKDIMTENVIYKNSDDSMLEVANTMKENDIGLIPIVEDNKVIGVITDRDIVIRALVNNADIKTEAKKYITKDVISVKSKDKIDKVFNLMQEHQIKRILVIDKKELVGVISLSDLINRCDEDLLTFNTIKNIYKHNTIKGSEEAEVDDFPL
ncbi:MAG: CBS domain-containing protein [Bacilli bacterium]